MRSSLAGSPSLMQRWLAPLFARGVSRLKETQLPGGANRYALSSSSESSEGGTSR